MGNRIVLNDTGFQPPKPKLWKTIGRTSVFNIYIYFQGTNYKEEKDRRESKIHEIDGVLLINFNSWVLFGF